MQPKLNAPVPLRCLSCGAPDYSVADDRGVHRCEYCHGTYRTSQLRGTRPLPGGLAGRNAGRAVAVVLAAVGVFVSIGFVSWLWHGSRPSRIGAVPASNATFDVAGNDVTPTAEFAFHRRRGGPLGSGYLLGVVTNTSPVPLVVAQVIAVLHDDKGKEIRTYSGFAGISDLGPGESSPVSIWLMSPPKYASITYETRVMKAFSPPKRAEKLRVELGEPELNRSGDYVFRGVVFNDGDRPAESVRVEVVAYDGAGKILNFGNSFTKSRRVMPNDSSECDDVRLDIDEKPARFEVEVRGRPIE